MSGSDPSVMASSPQRATKRTTVIRFLATHKLLVVGAALTLIIGTIVYKCWRFYTTIYPTPIINFQEYAPTWLPPNVAVLSKSLQVRRQPTPNPALAELDITLSGYDRMYIERNDGKILPYFTYNCGTQYDGEMCVMATTPRGQRYQIVADALNIHNPNDFRYKHMQIKWLEGNTLSMYSTISRPYYSTATTGKIIDSMKPAYYTGLRTVYTGMTCATGPVCGLPDTDSLSSGAIESKTTVYGVRCGCLACPIVNRIGHSPKSRFKNYVPHSTIHSASCNLHTTTYKYHYGIICFLTGVAVVKRSP